MTEGEQRHFEVVLEDISGKLSLVLEGLDAWRKELKEKREDLNSEIQAVGDKVEGHEARIAVLEQRVA